MSLVLAHLLLNRHFAGHSRDARVLAARTRAGITTCALYRGKKSSETGTRKRSAFFFDLTVIYIDRCTITV